MNATRFNPDPAWSVLESEDGRRFTIDQDGGPMLPRKVIATVYNSRRVDGKANARLIAAAPDLLRALSAIVENTDKGYSVTTWTGLDGIADAGSVANLDAARAAIARATGGGK